VDAAWERITARLEGVLRDIERVAAHLFDRELDRAEVVRAEAAARRIASWLGHLGLPAAAELTRQLAALWGRSELHVGSAIEVAGLVDELRSQLSHAASDLWAPSDDSPGVTVVGPTTATVDSVVWAAASAGLRVDSSDTGLDIPWGNDAIAVFCGSSAGGVDTIVVRGLAERLPGTPLLAIVDAPSVCDRRALGRVANVVLDSNTPPRHVVDELRRLCTASTQAEVVAVLSPTDTTLSELLTDHGVTAVHARDADQLMALLGGGGARGVVLPAALADEERVSMIRLVRTHPGIRTMSVVAIVGTDDAAVRVRLYRAGADDVIGPVDGDELAGRVKAALVRRAHLHSSDLDSARRRLLPWSSSRILIDRLLTSSQRRGHVSSLALVITGIDVPGAMAVDERYELLQGSFRDGDVVGRRSGDQIVIALSGAPRRTAVARVADMLAKLGLAESHRVGVSEFPHDGRNVDDLVRAAEEAIVRSRDAGGPMAVATDWRPEQEQAPDVAIIDPDATLAGVLAVALERQGLRAIHFQDGGEALDQLVGPNRRPLPRVVLLEFDTPGVEGLQLLRRLGEDGALSQLRVLMLTSRKQESDLRRAFELGAVDVVEKPFPAALMMQRLRRTLEQ
jgi:DNA-binding response OmpR family regulator